MDTREWKPVFRLTMTFDEPDFSIFIIDTPSRPIAYIPCTMWIPTRGSTPRWKMLEIREIGWKRERERERSVLVTAVGRAVFFARAPVSIPSPEMQRENRPIEISYPLFVFARNRRTVSIYTIERVEICVADDFSVTNISPSVSGR